MANDESSYTKKINRSLQECQYERSVKNKKVERLQEDVDQLEDKLTKGQREKEKLQRDMDALQSKLKCQEEEKRGARTRAEEQNGRLERDLEEEKRKRDNLQRKYSKLKEQYRQLKSRHASTEAELQHESVSTKQKLTSLENKFRSHQAISSDDIKTLRNRIEKLEMAVYIDKSPLPTSCSYRVATSGSGIASGLYLGQEASNIKATSFSSPTTQELSIPPGTVPPQNNQSSSDHETPKQLQFRPQAMSSEEVKYRSGQGDETSPDRIWAAFL
jgi:myosin heavy subunit